MSTLDEIVTHARRLPEELRQQALQYIEFLEIKSPNGTRSREAFTTCQDKSERGRQVATILQELADLGAFSELEDPVQWQREVRKDRPLPARD